LLLSTVYHDIIIFEIWYTMSEVEQPPGSCPPLSEPGAVWQPPGKEMGK
jgi:hypothetical protein